MFSRFDVVKVEFFVGAVEHKFHVDGKMLHAFARCNGVLTP